MVRYAAKQYSVLTIPYDAVLKKEMAAPIAEQELKSFFDEQNAYRIFQCFF